MNLQVYLISVLFVLLYSVFQCATFVGTVTYMSPERIRNENYSYPADIWSLGLALFECGTGEFPYTANEGPVNLMLQVNFYWFFSYLFVLDYFNRICNLVPLLPRIYNMQVWGQTLVKFAWIAMELVLLCKVPLFFIP